MKKSIKNKIYNDLKELFPVDYKDNKLCDVLSFCQSVLNKKIKNINSPRILDENNNTRAIVEEFSNLPEFGKHSNLVYEKIVSNFFINIPRWRHPNLQYNVGAPVSTGSCALYALALDENIYNINNGLAGNSLLAEQAVTNILSDLAGLNKNTVGFFTFGGTATNYYATKIGIKKSSPESSKKGVSKRTKVFVTKDAHFSHIVSADWLGVGTDNVIVIDVNKNRGSDVIDAEKKMRRELEKGNIISSIIINGGTTYGHVIDDILSFVKMRNRLVKEFSLPYSPHIHVDSVIGWTWLMFKSYDFSENILDIDRIVLKKIKKQYSKISKIKYADSWGVDFHKGVGSCPVDCSIFMMNNVGDLTFISKKESSNINMHQIAPEFSLESPADYTLETSRSGGAPLAALTALHTIGKRGFQRNLANLIEQSVFMRKLISSIDDMLVCYEKISDGYVTMVRIYPPEIEYRKYKKNELFDDSKKNTELIKYINRYMKDFFSWDSKNRMVKGVGVEYSFSGEYVELSAGVKISGLKFYPVSPHFNKSYAKKAISDIIKQKRYFDKNIWRKN